MTVRIGESLEGIDWAQAKADLAADDFDNGRSPAALQASFERSQHVAIAGAGDRVAGCGAGAGRRRHCAGTGRTSHAVRGLSAAYQCGSFGVYRTGWFDSRYLLRTP